MSENIVGFIGGGNMATALIRGLIADGVPAGHILVSEPDKSRREQLASSLNVRTREDNAATAREADTVILATKPQILRQVVEPLAEQLQQTRPLVISIAAGITHQALQGWLGASVPLVRAMPNTPAMVQTGATGLYADSGLDDETRMRAESTLRAVGLTQWVEDEKLMDAVTAISGSGPAYFFLFIEALQEAGEALGLAPETARLLSLQTAMGASKMALESPLPARQLRAQVTSPGGTTEQAVKTFEEQGIRSLVKAAATAARDKSIDLSEQLGKS